MLNPEVKLLSAKPLNEFTPEEFKTYIKSLFWIRPKKMTAKVKRKAKTMREQTISARITKTGKLSVRTARQLRYFTTEELAEIVTKMNRPENEVFLTLLSSDFLYLTHEEAAILLDFAESEGSGEKKE